MGGVVQVVKASDGSLVYSADPFLVASGFRGDSCRTLNPAERPTTQTTGTLYRHFTGPAANSPDLHLDRKQIHD